MNKFNVTDVYLTFNEVLLLKKFNKQTILKKSEHMNNLIYFELIKPEYIQTKYGSVPDIDGMYSISKFGETYLLYRKEKIFLNKLPVIISLIALISSFRIEILWIIQQLMQILKNTAGI